MRNMADSGGCRLETPAALTCRNCEGRLIDRPKEQKQETRKQGVSLNASETKTQRPTHRVEARPSALYFRPRGMA
jgi:hypothetical protein